jgi:uncharacterized repeat protein (TIGR04138 family)
MSDVEEIGPISDDDPFARILAKETRYARAAYEFTQQALGITIRRTGEQRHVSAAELLDGIRSIARAQFGPLTRGVLADWGVRTTRDFGEIVFLLIDVGTMKKTDEDTLEDFDDVFDFVEAFPDDLGAVQIVNDDPEDD